MEFISQLSHETDIEHNLSKYKSTSTLILTKNNGKTQHHIEQHDDDNTSVRVALRIRPQLSRERLEMCKVCTYVTPNEPQVTLGADKSFTFDHVFDINTKQNDIFNACIKNLIDSTLDGYNATVLAYGQTGSGKTYTMGTSFDINILPEEDGIIPRAVQYLFKEIDERCKLNTNTHYAKIQYSVYAQFMELYNEEIVDLFDTNINRELSSSSPSSSSTPPTSNNSFLMDVPVIQNRFNKQKIEIHEDLNNNVYVSGCTTRAVNCANETLELLKNGARLRTTASTNMNLTSSRSHAIFTLHVKQQRFVLKSNNTIDENDIESLSAKFHFVDLAGSERLKRTGAIGERAKEGICINRGLLALGNVISALGDDEKRGSHVPYRDSKLTRLLQDSLGGNSRTLMIACVSSSDSDFMETLNTLRYANRARNIKNKVVINQDKTSKQIALLRAEIQTLQLELMEYKAGKKISITNGNCVDNILLDNGATINVNDLKQENFLIKSENNSLRIRCKAMQDTIDNIRDKNVKLLTELELVKINNPNFNLNILDLSNNNNNNVVQSYMEQIEDLRCKLVESECTCQHLRKSIQLFNSKNTFSVVKQNAAAITDEDMTNDSQTKAIQLLLDEAKKDVEIQKQKIQLKSTQSIPINKSSPKFTLNSDRIRLISASGIELRTTSRRNSSTSSSTTPTNFDNILTSSQILSEAGSQFNIDESCIIVDDEQETEQIQQNGQLQENLTNLDVEIDMKQRLINELEIQKKNYDKMKYHYEEKLLILHDRISKIEDERDKVLSNITKLNQDNKYDDQIRKVKMDYENKIKNLQYEVHKYSSLKQKHSQMVKIQNDNEKQLTQLSNELIEMKKLKVKLMNQLKEETQKYRAHELKRKREIEVLKRDQLKKENQIKSLNEDNKRKAVILKRKQEQIQALSKRNTVKMSDKAAGRMTSSLILTNSNSGHNNSMFNNNNNNNNINSGSAKVTQNKWRNIENNIQSIITKKQTICLIERDMERYLEQREKLGRKLNRFGKRLEKLFALETPERNKVDELKEQIEIMKSNIDYIQDQISECQANIIELDEAKDKRDLLTSQKLISSINSVDEAKYLVDKFFTMALNKGVLAAQKEYLNKELELELRQFEREHYTQQQLLQQFMNGEMDYQNGNMNGNNDFEIDEIILAPQINDSSDSDSSDTRSNSPVVPLRMTKLLSGTTILRKNNEEKQESVNVNNNKDDEHKQQLSRIMTDKARTQIANGPEDYLYGMPTEPLNSRTRLLSQSYTKLAPNNKNAPVIDTDDSYYSSILILNNDDDINMDYSRSRTKSMSRQNSKESLLSTSPNGSPHMFTKRSSTMRDDNVFNRLTSESKQTPLPEVGTIKSYTGSTTRFRSSPITCTHIAEGHSKAVLSVDAYDYKLFSSSKDRTAKIWDLHTGQEILSLIGHPNNVLKIKYCPNLNLIFTVSSSYVKVWDMRDTKCVKTLSSSGLVIDGDLGIYRSTRTLQNEIPIGEHQINDIALDKFGTKLYTAAGNAVKIWDLKQFLPVGKLSGGQNSTIMTLAIDNDDFDNNMVITGSKDHYIKIFDVNNGIGVIPPKRNLVPPHYDGVQSLTIVGDILFSGSRDMCIKKWDLVDYHCKQSINNAHKDWISVLDYLSDVNCLMSACRAGYLKFWNIDTCEKLSEFRAHLLQINSIKIDNNFVFTASDDSTIKIWKKNY